MDITNDTESTRASSGQELDRSRSAKGAAEPSRKTNSLWSIARIYRIVFVYLFRSGLRDQTHLLGLGAARLYVRGIVGMRRTTLFIVAGVGCIALFVSGIVMSIGALLALLPLQASTVAWIGLIVGLLVTISGCVALAVAFSSSRWMRLSRADAVVEQALRPTQKTTEVAKNLLNAFK